MPKTDVTAFAARTVELIAANAIHAICLILAFVPVPFILYYITELHLWGTDLQFIFQTIAFTAGIGILIYEACAPRHGCYMRSCLLLFGFPYVRARYGLAASYSNCSWYLMATLRGVACYGITSLRSRPRFGAVATKDRPAAQVRDGQFSKNCPSATNLVAGMEEYGFAYDADYQSAL